MRACVCVCVFVCVCVGVCACVSSSYVWEVCLSLFFSFVCMFIGVVHYCVDGVAVFVGMLVTVDIRVFVHVGVDMSIMRLAVCFEVRLRLCLCRQL